MDTARNSNSMDVMSDMLLVRVCIAKAIETVKHATLLRCSWLQSIAVDHAFFANGLGCSDDDRDETIVVRLSKSPQRSAKKSIVVSAALTTAFSTAQHSIAQHLSIIIVIIESNAWCGNRLRYMALSFGRFVREV